MYGIITEENSMEGAEMVYTLTLNPALDYVMKTGALSFDNINRSKGETLSYGGKGINVSVILSRLGIENKALGFLAGFTGEQLEKMLISDGISCDFVYLESGNTRINVKIRAEKELDINADGPQIKEADIERLLEKLNCVKAGDFVVIAGALPENAPQNAYEIILSRFEGRGVNFVVDASGDLLKSVLKYKPFLIKPNHLELSALFKADAETDEEIEKYARQLQADGAGNVLVSRAEKGALLVDENGGVSKIGAVTGELINSVGSGDSMVAGFIAGYIKTGSFEYALKLGNACGAATAFSPLLADKNKINELLNAVL